MNRIGGDDGWVCAPEPLMASPFGGMALVLVAACLLVPAAQVAEAPSGSVTQAFGLGRRDVARARGGTPVVRTLPTDDGREVALVGAVAIPINPEAYLAHLEDIEAFKRADAVRQIGRLSMPPVRTDFADLRLEPSEIASLKSCHLGDCDLQLPAATIESLRQLTWRTPGSGGEAVQLVRQLLFEVTDGYVNGGYTGLAYRHADEAVSPDREFRSLLGDDRFALPHLPELRNRLRRGDVRVGAGGRDFLYWSREKIARKVVLSVTHVAVEFPPQLPGGVAIASRQLYASHYFHASLGLTLLLPEGPSSTLVVYANRSRVDAFDGFFGGLLRPLVQRRAASALRTYLRALRARLERTSTSDTHASLQRDRRPWAPAVVVN